MLSWPCRGRGYKARPCSGQGGDAPADRLFRLATRLGQVPAGSMAADHTIHDALGLIGKVPFYTREETAARRLLPAGFEWVPSTGSLVYAACQRSGWDGEWQHPHYGQ